MARCRTRIQEAGTAFVQLLDRMVWLRSLQEVEHLLAAYHSLPQGACSVQGWQPHPGWTCVHQASRRAFTKHPEVVGLTKQTLRQAYGTDVAINCAAHDTLKQIMRCGVRTTPVLPRYGAVIQCQIPGSFGARWYAASARTGTFIGLIYP
jgi:hypothetical protein